MTTTTSASTSPTATTISWRELLRQAFQEPGRLAAVYHVLHDFSIGNQVLAMTQAAQKGLAIGPIGTYRQWQRVGRQVRRGEKAISLWRPITWDVTEKNDQTGEDTVRTVLSFVLKPHWFLLAQTDGPDYSEPEPVGDWDWRRACQALKVTKTAFEATIPALGYAARDKRIAVAPWNPHPLATICHELAHVVLGHLDDGNQTPKAVQEIQAESVAYLIGATVGFGGAVDQRGYIQWWAERGGVKGVDDLTESQVRAIFSAAEKIRQAGMPGESTETTGDRAVAA